MRTARYLLPRGVPVAVNVVRRWRSGLFGAIAVAVAALSTSCTGRVDTVVQPRVTPRLEAHGEAKAAVIDDAQQSNPRADIGDQGDVGGDNWIDQRILNLSIDGGLVLLCIAAGILVYALGHRWGWFRRAVDRVKGRNCWDPQCNHRPGERHQ